MSIQSFLTKIRQQKAVYWGTPAPDGKGQYTFATSVEIDCRWEDKFTMITTIEGDEVMSKTMVIADRDLDEGGFLWLGSKTISTPTSPIGLNKAYKIQRIERIPDVYNKTTVYIAYL